MSNDKQWTGSQSQLVLLHLVGHESEWGRTMVDSVRQRIRWIECSCCGRNMSVDNELDDVIGELMMDGSTMEEIEDYFDFAPFYCGGSPQCLP